jgi:hypothetical protein
MEMNFVRLVASFTYPIRNFFASFMRRWIVGGKWNGKEKELPDEEMVQELTYGCGFYTLPDLDGNEETD